ncbi:MAG: UDP-N-acetylmuramoyl-L-alanine--D-glutamate ligase [Actinobacteria bacterium]|nr:UDP-N-acetylmuramoyl-L-alanine--D-glutamate ligase [Actinomycetota bacterium]
MATAAAQITGLDRLLVIGMGRSGTAAALAARRLLPGADIILADQQRGIMPPETQQELLAHGIRLEPGREDSSLLDGCSLVIKSPGVPVGISLLVEARGRGIRVWGELEFAWRHLPQLMVGVTGTNGKTTTTELIGHILKGAGRACRVAGNVGTALSSLVGVAGEDEILVVELSSFQLEDSEKLRPDIAVLLNLTEDHLDRHPDAAHYFGAKMQIFANQSPADLAIINQDDPNCRAGIPGAGQRIWFSREALAAVQPLVYAQGGIIYARQAELGRAVDQLRRRLPGGGHGLQSGAATGSGRNGPAGGEVPTEAENSGPQATHPTEVIAWSEASLIGEHNLENSLAACAVGLALGLAPEEIAAGLKSFPGVRHRLQEVRRVNGVRYINDSKATNVDAAVKALTAFKGGIHLILGGSLTGCSFDGPAAAAAVDRVREVILIGEAATEIEASFWRQGRRTVMAGDLQTAVKLASGRVVDGDVVLLAPACASYDQYDNYEQRGEHFISLVNKL